MSIENRDALDRVSNRTLWTDFLGISRSPGLVHAFDEEDPGFEAEALIYEHEGIRTVIFAGKAHEAIPEFNADNILRVVPGFEGTPLAELPAVKIVLQQERGVRQAMQMATEALQAKGLAVTVISSLVPEACNEQPGDIAAQVDAFIRSGAPASLVKRWCEELNVRKYPDEDDPAVMPQLLDKLAQWREATAPAAEPPA